MVVVLGLAWPAAGCSSEPDTEPSDAGRPVTSATASAETVPDFPVAGVESRQQARLVMPGGPDWLVADTAGVWVKRDSGYVDLVDPATTEVVRSVEVGGDLCQGIGAGFGAIWTCSGTDVVRVDPQSGEVTARLPLNKAFEQGNLATGFDRLWVLIGDGSTLAGVDPASGTVTTTVDLGVRGTDLGVGAAGLWVASKPDDTVVRVDPDRAEVMVEVGDIDSPVAVSVTDEVWIGAAASTVRLDPATGEPVTTSPIGTGGYGGLAVTRDAVWVRSPNRFLVRLDPSDGRAVEGFTADTPSGGSVLVAFGSVWATAFDDDVLFRVRPTG
ncbi:hypothetical protein C1I92_22335 [Jiangella anatolica]|uniref:SMP-30/Gluconolactonase/LRE-like region domain-containing protein n=2 Tax=Jiangella anatolica TaxID=2670374 RepID=A0A2W2BLM6_9ACTN|nr:hypothetical protein C1I92_22335 [Jiangella anatolica]